MELCLRTDDGASSARSNSSSTSHLACRNSAPERDGALRRAEHLARALRLASELGDPLRRLES